MVEKKSKPKQNINFSVLPLFTIATLNMESVSKITIFGLKTMVKSRLEKFILKSLHAGRWLFVSAVVF